MCPCMEEVRLSCSRSTCLQDACDCPGGAGPAVAIHFNPTHQSNLLSCYDGIVHILAAQKLHSMGCIFHRISSKPVDALGYAKA
jgi:hypothetical protein